MSDKALREWRIHCRIYLDEMMGFAEKVIADHRRTRPDGIHHPRAKLRRNRA